MSQARKAARYSWHDSWAPDRPVNVLVGRPGQAGGGHFTLSANLRTHSDPVERWPLLTYESPEEYLAGIALAMTRWPAPLRPGTRDTGATAIPGVDWRRWPFVLRGCARPSEPAGPRHGSIGRICHRRCGGYRAARHALDRPPPASPGGCQREPIRHVHRRDEGLPGLRPAQPVDRFDLPPLRTSSAGLSPPHQRDGAITG
jgi:hypothetical protein